MAIEAADVRRLARRILGSGSMRHRINLLGVGGVGSNVLRVADHFPSRMMFRIYDDDEIELHNLNRTTLFQVANVGDWKTRVAFRNCTQGMIKDEYRIKTDANTEFMMGTIVDARDTLDPAKLHKDTWIKLAYDGGSSISFTFKPWVVSQSVFSLDSGDSYAVVPSFFVPAAMLSIISFRYAEFLNFAEITDLKAGTVGFDIDQLAQDVMFEWAPEETENE